MAHSSVAFEADRVLATCGVHSVADDMVHWQPLPARVASQGNKPIVQSLTRLSRIQIKTSQLEALLFKITGHHSSPVRVIPSTLLEVSPCLRSLIKSCAIFP